MGTLLGIGIGLGIGRIGKEYAMREIERAANKDGLLKKYYADYIEGIEGKTKEIIEYRRLKAGAVKAGKHEVLYDEINKNNTSKTVENIVEYKNTGANNGQKQESTASFIRRVRKAYTDNNGRFEPYEKRSNNLYRKIDTESNGRFQLESNRSVNGNVRRLVENSYIPSEKLSQLFQQRGYVPTVYNELKRRNDKSAQYFYNVIGTAKEQLGKKGSTVYKYSIEDYKKMRLFVSEDGLSGFALKDDGDIVSVFSVIPYKGKSHSILELAIQEGGVKLDCFDTHLPKLYKAHGFKEVRREKWNEKYKPADWDKEYYKMYNNGEPDVVYMELQK